MQKSSNKLRNLQNSICEESLAGLLRQNRQVECDTFTNILRARSLAVHRFTEWVGELSVLGVGVVDTHQYVYFAVEVLVVRQVLLGLSSDTVLEPRLTSQLSLNTTELSLSWSWNVRTRPMMYCQMNIIAGCHNMCKCEGVGTVTEC